MGKLIESILITNDDGIDAPGIKILESIASQLSDNVWVVAPEKEHSGGGSAITLRKEFNFRKITAQKYAIDGTPADCILTALQHFMKDERPNLVLSGINPGDNAGDAIYTSGTFHAASFAEMQSIPAAAISQMRQPDRTINWELAEKTLPHILADLWMGGWKSSLLNINMPACTPDKFQGVKISNRQKATVDYNVTESKNGILKIDLTKSFKASRNFMDTDVEQLATGFATITPIKPYSVKTTDRDKLEKIKFRI